MGEPVDGTPAADEHSDGGATQELPRLDRKALAEFLDTYFAERTVKPPRFRRLRKPAVWALSVIVTALLLHDVIPFVNQAIVSASCAAKYETASSQFEPPVRMWVPYGSTLTRYNQVGGTFTIQPEPQLLNDEEWFGAALSYSRTCDYRLSFAASLTAPLLESNPGWGYAVGARGKVVNGWPYGSTVQFDPANGGIRTVILPMGANQPGYNSQPFAGVTSTGEFRHWTITIQGNQMYASFNGQPYPPVTLEQGHGTDIIFRTWNGRLSVRSFTITSLPNSLARDIGSVRSFFTSL
jgi:hypothetical protein